MIIAQYDGDTSFYVFGVYGAVWASETDTWHEELEDAVDQLDWEYRGLSKEIVWYESPNPAT
jgi:hypothetical protein